MARHGGEVSRPTPCPLVEYLTLSMHIAARRAPGQKDNSKPTLKLSTTEHQHAGGAFVNGMRCWSSHRSCRECIPTQGQDNLNESCVGDSHFNQ